MSVKVYVYLAERCGTEMGVPGGRPNGRWQVTGVFASKQGADLHIAPMRVSDFDHVRVRRVQVKP